MSALPPSARFVVPDDVVFRDVVGEAMILHLKTGTYFGLDAVGTRIWQLVVERHPLEAVCATMAEEFDAPADRIHADVRALIAQLLDKQLLRAD